MQVAAERNAPGRRSFTTSRAADRTAASGTRNPSRAPPFTLPKFERTATCSCASPLSPGHVRVMRETKESRAAVPETSGLQEFQALSRFPSETPFLKVGLKKAFP